VNPLISLSPPPALSVPPEPASPAVAEPIDATGRTAAAEPPASFSRGSGGHADSALPPAIGAASDRSNWAGLVLGRLEQFRQYPVAARAKRQEGVCYVRFTIDRKGHVLASSLDRTSGHASLDREAVALVRRADPLPAPPAEIDGETVTLSVPVEFFLTR
jgi:protein TonB